LDEKLEKLHSSSVGILGDQQKDDDGEVKNFEIDFQTSDQQQKASLRKVV
jgi:hypothetical protein